MRHGVIMQTYHGGKSLKEGERKKEGARKKEKQEKVDSSVQRTGRTPHLSYNTQIERHGGSDARATANEIHAKRVNCFTNLSN